MSLSRLVLLLFAVALPLAACGGGGDNVGEPALQSQEEGLTLEPSELGDSPEGASVEKSETGALVGPPSDVCPSTSRTRMFRSTPWCSTHSTAASLRCQMRPRILSRSCEMRSGRSMTRYMASLTPFPGFRTMISFWGTRSVTRLSRIRSTCSTSGSWSTTRLTEFPCASRTDRCAVAPWCMTAGSAIEHCDSATRVPYTNLTW